MFTIMILVHALLFSCIVSLQFPFCDASPIVFHSVEDYDKVSSLDDMIAYLRHDDNRLVRFNIPDSDAAERQETACTEDLDAVMQLFDSEPSLPNDETLKAVKVMTLCSLENPTFREKIGAYNNNNNNNNSNSNSVLASVVSLIQEGGEAAAIAGEAIWILSFNNANNHRYFVQHALPKLIEIVVHNGVMEGSASASLSAGETVDEEDAILAEMWAMAALQNLAASYCHTDSGHCWWEFDDTDTAEVTKKTGTGTGIYLHQESEMTIDGSEAAYQMTKSKMFVQKLHRLVCSGGIEEEDGEWEWASEATVDDTEVHPKLRTWAAAGVLKNLSMYAKSKNVTYGAKHCLCDLLYSEDWLESSKAEDALFRLGLDPDEDCFGNEEEDREL